jgi:hypothetical protein
MTSIDSLINRRNALLVTSAALFAVWQGAWLVSDLLAGDGSVGSAPNLLTLLAACGWIAVTIASFVFNKEVIKARACAVMNDELTQSNRKRSFVIAYIVLVAGIAAWMVAEEFLELPRDLIVRSLLILAVVTPSLTFVYYETRNSRGPDGA